MNGFSSVLCAKYLWIISLLSLFTINSQAQFTYPPCPSGLPGFQDCEDINCSLCNLNGYTGSTSGYGSDPDADLAPFFCGTVESVQYLSFIPQVTQISFTVTVSNCSVNSGIDVGVMLLCDAGLWACTPGNGSNSSTVTVSNLQVGISYVLVVDVDAASDCNFTVATSPANATVNPDNIIPSTLTIVGDQSVCPNEETVYQLAPNDFTADFTWSAPAGTLINGASSPITIAGSEGSAVTVTWGTTGGNICVTPFNICNTGNTICLPVVVTPIPPTVLPTITICAEEVPYTLPWDEEIYQSGSYSTVIPSVHGCDSMLIQPMVVKPAIVTFLPPTFLCVGSCITVCGESYCNYGSFSVHCQSVSGCDSLINFTILAPNLVANILGEDTLTCSLTTITLQSSPTAGVKIWTNANGQTLGTGPTLSISTPGTYYLYVSALLGSETCVYSDSVVIMQNTSGPLVSATGAMFGCDTLPVFIHSSANALTTNYSWTGPGGFSSMQQNPAVPGTGIYVVTAVDTATGCFGIDTAIVVTCCQTFAGTMDSLSIVICGSKNLIVPWNNTQILEPGDSLVFILYSNPSAPLTSIIMESASPVFPFVNGVIQFDSTYYVAAMAGQILPGNVIDTSGSCFSVTSGVPVKWHLKPTIATPPVLHEVCKGGCLDVEFSFTGTPPFQFSYEISQNGQPVFVKNEVSDSWVKSVTVCPSMFTLPAGTSAVHFRVTSINDLYCGCND